MADATEIPGLKAALEELEIQRKSILNYRIGGWITVVATVLSGLYYAGLLTSRYPSFLGMGIAALIFFCGLALAFSSDNDYPVKYKSKVITAILNHYDPNATFNPKDGISMHTFNRSYLSTKNANDYSSEDMATCTLGKTKFIFSEVSAWEKVPTEKEGYEYTCLLVGLLFIADFNKKFNGNTVCKEPFFSEVWPGSSPVEGLENSTFTKHFATVSTDSIEARYILTPLLMERICEINAEFGNSISLSFADSCVHIAVPFHTRNLFEPPVYKSLLDPDVIKREFGLITSLFDIVKELDLNTRIWSKR